MQPCQIMRLLIGLVLAFTVGCSSAGTSADRAASDGPTTTSTSVASGPTTTVTGTATTEGSKVETVAGMPQVEDRSNLYGSASAGRLAPATADALPRVYVPNGKSGTVSVIDPSTFKVVDEFSGGLLPQHVVPAYDLTRLWVLDNNGNQLIPIDPKTAKPGPPVQVDDPYNLYFTPDGTQAIVVAERERRLDFRDPQTMELESSLDLPCRGLNHMDFSIDGRWAIATCEFAGSLVKLDMVKHELVDVLKLGPGRSMPQDVRISPDGSRFFVADMAAGGVWIVSGGPTMGWPLAVESFVPTGVGAHGLYPSRDGTKLYVANRGWATTSGGRNGPGGVSVIDFATDKVVADWPVPGGGSPDMGNVTADGTQLWLSGRYDSEVYVFRTTDGHLLAQIPVGDGPHGLTVWPQPGRFSLGHTGNMR